jgi:hypothetical protein
MTIPQAKVLSVYPNAAVNLQDGSARVVYFGSKSAFWPFCLFLPDVSGWLELGKGPTPEAAWDSAARRLRV